jgi:hypothetical protein
MVGKNLFMLHKYAREHVVGRVEHENRIMIYGRCRVWRRKKMPETTGVYFTPLPRRTQLPSIWSWPKLARLVVSTSLSNVPKFVLIGWLVLTVWGRENWPFPYKSFMAYNKLPCITMQAMGWAVKQPTNQLSNTLAIALTCIPLQTKTRTQV